MTITAGVEAARETLAGLEEAQVAVMVTFDSIDRAKLCEYLTNYIRKVGAKLPDMQSVFDDNAAAWLDTLRQQLDEVSPASLQLDYEYIDRILATTDTMVKRVFASVLEKHPDMGVEEHDADRFQELQSLRYVMIEQRQATGRHFDWAKESIRDVMIDAGIGRVSLETAEATLEGITSRCAAKIVLDTQD